jgi:hypothetical protein
MKRIAVGIGVIFLLVSLCGFAGANGKSADGGQKSITLGAPTTLRLVIVPNGFKLSWNPSPQDPGIVTRYEIVRSYLASGPFIKIATVDKGVSQYVDTTVSPENIYYYKVRAVAGTVYSPYSNTVTGEGKKKSKEPCSLYQCVIMERCRKCSYSKIGIVRILF